MKNTNWYIDPPFGDVAKDTVYHTNHKGRAFLQKLANKINSFTDCKSILDVGCKSTGFLGKINNKYIKTATDICKPGIFGMDEKGFTFIHGDFLTLPLGNYDVVCCFEVLEHIRPDVRRAFAQKLLSITNKHLFVSIPYMWAGTNKTEVHPHDGYNEANLNEWFWPHYFDEGSIEQGRFVAHYYKGLRCK